MIVDIGEERKKLQRERSLSEAYNWGQRVKETQGSFDVEWAVFLAQYGIDPDAQKHFMKGYEGVAGP